MMPKSQACACGIRCKVHARKSRRGQLPPLSTDRRGYPTKFSAKRREVYRRKKLLREWFGFPRRIVGYMLDKPRVVGSIPTCSLRGVVAQW